MILVREKCEIWVRKQARMNEFLWDNSVSREGKNQESFLTRESLSKYVGQPPLWCEDFRFKDMLHENANGRNAGECHGRFPEQIHPGISRRLPAREFPGADCPGRLLSGSFPSGRFPSRNYPDESLRHFAGPVVCRNPILEDYILKFWLQLAIGNNEVDSG